MSLMIMIDGNVQRHWGPILGICIGLYIIVKGAIARQWTVIPRRSPDEPFKFTPRWYHRLLMVFMGAATAVLSLKLLLK